MLPTSILTVDVATEVIRCMCGIAVSQRDSETIPESLLSIARRVAVFP
jgi:hypothetical protein